jgi:hypothetical protein
MTHPTQVTVNGQEFLQWCERAKTGEVHIPTVVVTDNGRYRLTLQWRKTPPQIQKDLFAIDTQS